jgi:hypothetical protein
MEPRRAPSLWTVASDRDTHLRQCGIDVGEQVIELRTNRVGPPVGRLHGIKVAMGAGGILIGLTDHDGQIRPERVTVAGDVRCEARRLDSRANRLRRPSSLLVIVPKCA